MGGKTSKPVPPTSTSTVTGTEGHNASGAVKPGQGNEQGVQAAGSEHVSVTPSDVVVYGSGVVTAAAVLSAVATYRSGSKSLLDDGINPSNRMRMIPVAVQTLMLSTLFTGILGVGGFYGLRAAGFFSHDTAELPSASEAARMIKAPRAYIRDALSREKEQTTRPNG